MLFEEFFKILRKIRIFDNQINEKIAMKLIE